MHCICFWFMSRIQIKCKQSIKSHLRWLRNFTLSLAEAEHEAFLKILRSYLNWAAFIGDLTSGLIIAAGCINHHKRNDWLDSEVIKVNWFIYIWPSSFIKWASNFLLCNKLDQISISHKSSQRKWLVRLWSY